MSKKDLLINFVVDRSGSMASMTNATIQGINEYLESQLKEKGKTYLSMTLFSTDFEVRYVGVDVKEVPAMSRSGKNAYIATGGTALYDAVGTAIRGTEGWLANNPWFNGKVLTVIWTDGEENSSRLWNIDALNKTIEEKTQEGWTFTFLGSGASAWLEGQKFTSIPTAMRSFTVNSATSYGQSYAGLASNSSTLRGGGSWDATLSNSSEAEDLLSASGSSTSA